jgi:hypothetical protein
MPGDDLETAQPSPDTLAYATTRARTAALIAAAGIATYLGFVVATRNVFLFEVADVVPIFVALIVLNSSSPPLPRPGRRGDGPSIATSSSRWWRAPSSSTGSGGS